MSREGEEEEERERESYQLHGVRDLNAAIGHGLDHDPHVFEQTQLFSIAEVETADRETRLVHRPVTPLPGGGKNRELLQLTDNTSTVSCEYNSIKNDFRTALRYTPYMHTVGQRVQPLKQRTVLPHQRECGSIIICKD